MRVWRGDCSVTNPCAPSGRAFSFAGSGGCDDFSDDDGGAEWAGGPREQADGRSMFFKDDFVAQGLVAAEHQVSASQLPTVSTRAWGAGRAPGRTLGSPRTTCVPLRQVEKVELKYATVAKRVDVAQLKRDVWARRGSSRPETPPRVGVGTALSYPIRCLALCRRICKLSSVRLTKSRRKARRLVWTHAHAERAGLW